MLARLRDRLDGAPVTRFAPPPTGRLHLGHIVNAVYVWGVARALEGSVRLRIEDHDRERSRPEYDRGIFEDLEWLGFVADVAGRQSDHVDRYWDALHRLSDADLVYWCDCSRQRIARDAGGDASELRYDGRCRERGLGPGPNRGIRVRLSEDEQVFDEALLGRIRQVPARQCGVLGRDRPPVFLHHPLVLAADGEKLSKSNRETGICELRDAGVSPAEVIGRAAAAAGLIDRVRPTPATEVERLFPLQ